MATWTPIAEGRRREVGLTGVRETLLYGTEDLTVTSDVTIDTVHDIELNAPGVQGDPHPDADMRSRGAILQRKYLVLGPSNGRAVVALEYGPPTRFGPGNTPRLTVEITSQGGRNVLWPKATLYPLVGPPAPTDPRLYWIDWVEGPRRATLTRFERKAFNIPAFATFDQALAAVYGNLGKGYVFNGIPFILDDFSLVQTQGSLGVLTYLFRSTAPVRGLVGPSGLPVGNGFDLVIPPLNWLEQWYVNDLDSSTGSIAAAIKVHTAADLYDEGTPLP